MEYTYDKNGNLTKDLNKDISKIGYNLLNLPDEVTFANGNSIRYEYAADGTKLRTVHKTGATTLTTDYCGNAVYENGVLRMLLNEAGYVSFPDRKFHFYLKDHQGNTRVVADKDGNVEETKAYYPIGGTFTSTASVQPYKYNGKIIKEPFTEEYAASTNPSDPNKFGTVGKNQLLLAVRSKHKNKYWALQMRTLENSSFVPAEGVNPRNLSNFVSGANIHKAGINNATSSMYTPSLIRIGHSAVPYIERPSKYSGVSEGCYLIDINKWQSFMSHFPAGVGKVGVITSN